PIPRSDPPPHLHSFPTRRSSDLSPPLPHAHPAEVAVAQSPVDRTADPGGLQGGRCATALARLAQRVRQQPRGEPAALRHRIGGEDRKSTRLNSSHRTISYAVFCL